MTFPTSVLSPADLAAAEAAVRTALAAVATEWDRPELAQAGPDTDLFEDIDSFSIVELLLETESQVEKAVGRYVALADESVLDAEKSPLRKLSSWVEHVGRAMTHG